MRRQVKIGLIERIAAFIRRIVMTLLLLVISIYVVANGSFDASVKYDGARFVKQLSSSAMEKLKDKLPELAEKTIDLAKKAF